MTAISQAIELSGLTKDKSAVLISKFGSMVEQITDWKQKAEALIITDESQTVEIATAKEGYKFIKAVRVDIEKTRKVLKEDSLKEGRAIDLIAKSLTEEVSPLELELEKKAKFVEIQEEKRKTARTQERLERASAFGFAVPQVGMIIEMSDEMFDVFLSGLKAEAERREAAIVAEKEAEIMAEMNAKVAREAAEKVEKERVESQRIENERLKIEAEKREAEIAEERKKVEAERIKQEAIQAEERRIEKERFWKIQAEKDAKIKAERNKAEALQAEINAKEYHEQMDRELKAEAERKALNAPDKEKLNLFLEELLNVRIPVLTASESKTLLAKMANEVEVLVERLGLEIDKL